MRLHAPLISVPPCIYATASIEQDNKP